MSGYRVRCGPGPRKGQRRNQRSNDLNPRALGTNPRALGTNPNPAKAETSAARWRRLARAHPDDLEPIEGYREPSTRSLDEYLGDLPPVLHDGWGGWSR